MAGDRLWSLSRGVQEAEDQNLVGALPATAGAAEEAAQARRRAVVRKRLGMLGYLKPTRQFDREWTEGTWREAGKFTRKLRQAIRAFQADANIVDDGWVGDVTWEVLQKLVSFETYCDVERWMQGQVASAALARAVHLRLFVFGFTSRGPTPDRLADLSFPLERFAEKVALLAPEHPPLEPALCLETIRALFDQDQLIAWLAREREDGEFPSELHDFARCMARVELWLLGYDVKPKGAKQKRRHKKKPVAGRTDTLPRAIRSFSAAQGLEDRPRRASPLFFRDLQALEEGAERAPDPAVLVDQALDDDKLRAAVTNEMQSFGSRIWDGVERAWRFIRKILGQGLDAIKSLVSNIARVVQAAAMRTFRVVRSALRAINIGFKMLVNKKVQGSNARHLYVEHDGDLDFTVGLHAQAEAAEVERISGDLWLRARLFNLGCRIIGALMVVFVGVAKIVATSGAAAVFSIAKVFRGASELLGLSIESERILDRLDGTQPASA